VNKLYALIPASALAAAILSSTACARRQSLSAKEHYLTILQDKAFADYIPPKSELDRIGRMPLNSRIPLDQVEAEARKSTPAKLLVPILDDLVRNMPAQLRRVPDVFAAVYPVGGFNARIVQTPAGGYLILLNYDLKKGLWEWAKLVVNAVAAQTDTGLRPDDTLEKLAEDFVGSVHEYNDAEHAPAFPQYATDDKGILVFLFHTAAVRFILAHEYAHILLGHAKPVQGRVADVLRGGDASRGKDDSFENELDADKLAIEMVVGCSSEVMGDPEMQALGVYYSLGMFAAIDAARNGSDRNVAYLGIDRRRKTVTALLEQRAAGRQREIWDGVTKAIDYLVLETRARTSRRERQDAVGIGLLAALDKKGAKKASKDGELISFMREFSRRLASSDWDGMRALVARSARWPEYVGILLGHATACSLKGVKSWNLPWSPDHALDAGGYAELAIAIHAANQGRSSIDQAVLDDRVRAQFLLLWRTLYGTALGAIGASDDGVPREPDFAEAMDKGAASLQIARLMKDPILIGFSALGGAWVLERTGRTADGLAVHRELGEDFKWPPIEKTPAGRYAIAYPLLDSRGKRIPASEKELEEGVP
jgi:hypothetical protein